MGMQIKVEGTVYFSENSRRIHLDIAGVRTDVTGEEGRAGYHPALFNKLAELLRAAGKPAPKRLPIPA